MLKIPKLVNSNDGVYVCWAHTEYAGFSKDSDEVAYKPLNTDFEVEINGIKCEVRECRVSAVPYNRPWPGRQRQLSQTESAGFISFSSDEQVEIRVKRKKKFDNALIRPLSKNIDVEVCDLEAVFTLKDKGQYVLEFGDSHNALHIFFNDIKEYPDAKNATFYFGPGIHFPGVIYLRDNDTVYVDESAIVVGSLYSLGAKNVKIFGGGVLDNSCEERITEQCYENHTKGNFRLYNCENIEVLDVIFTNSSTWVMSMFNCKNVHIDNVKIVGQWRYNTDGIDIVNSENVFIENSFIRSFDDTITIKAIYDYPKPIQNITVDNCVMWCGWGKNCELGVETAGVEYKNITFRNCDLIHNSVGALCVSNGNQAEMHDILFENMRVEFQSNTPKEMIQFEDSKEYDSMGETMPPVLIKCLVSPYSIRVKNADNIVRKPSEKLGDIYDVTYKNINIFTDADIKPVIEMKTRNADKCIRNFTLENIYINGTKAESLDDFDVKLENVQNITIK